jgi:hypothetical protein
MSLTPAGRSEGCWNRKGVARFEEAVLPHSAAVYNLARLLIRNHKVAKTRR